VLRLSSGLAWPNLTHQDGQQPKAAMAGGEQPGEPRKVLSRDSGIKTSASASTLNPEELKKTPFC
jgi:hypothetical protein